MCGDTQTRSATKRIPGTRMSYRHNKCDAYGNHYQITVTLVEHADSINHNAQFPSAKTPLTSLRLQSQTRLQIVSTIGKAFTWRAPEEPKEKQRCGQTSWHTGSSGAIGQGAATYATTTSPSPVARLPQKTAAVVHETVRVHGRLRHSSCPRQRRLVGGGNVPTRALGSHTSYSSRHGCRWLKRGARLGVCVDMCVGRERERGKAEKRDTRRVSTQA